MSFIENSFPAMMVINKEQLGKPDEILKYICLGTSKGSWGCQTLRGKEPKKEGTEKSDSILQSPSDFEACADFLSMATGCEPWTKAAAKKQKSH